jgi:hypothetical protein
MSCVRTEISKADEILAYLHGEGYKASMDEDGDIVFKYEGASYVVLFDPNDDLYTTIALPNIWSIDSKKERKRVERAALRATSAVKAVKVFPVKNNVWVAAESFSSSGNTIAVFARTLSAIGAATKKFVDTMRDSK